MLVDLEPFKKQRAVRKVVGLLWELVEVQSGLKKMFEDVQEAENVI